MEDYFSQLSPSDQQRVREHFLQQTNTKQASKQTSNMKVIVTKGDILIRYLSRQQVFLMNMLEKTSTKLWKQ